MKLFDSHCHLHFPQFDSDREKVINRLKKASIKVINVGTDIEDSKKAIELVEKYPDLMWTSVGIHPHEAMKTNINWDEFRKIASDDKVIAIGECGLDYYRVKEKPAPEGRGSLNEIDRQKEIFEKQIEITKELNKPLILHCRSYVGTQNSYEDALEILKFKNLNILNGNGVTHFFSGSKEAAKKFLDLGFYIGFAGPITFAKEYKELVEFVPLDRVLIETDAPFAAPAPHRGERNEPAYVEFVARQIAEWKNLNFEKIADQTTENTTKLFQI